MDENKALGTVKKVLVMATGVGAGAIVGAIVKRNVPTATMNLLMKTCVALGGFALGDVAADVACDKMDEFVTNTVSMAQEIVSEIQNPPTPDFVEA